MRKLTFSIAAITLMSTACINQQNTGIHPEKLDTPVGAHNE